MKERMAGGGEQEFVPVWVFGGIENFHKERIQKTGFRIQGTGYRLREYWNDGILESMQ